MKLLDTEIWGSDHSWCLCSSRKLHGINRQFVSEVLGQGICPIFKSPPRHEECHTSRDSRKVLWGTVSFRGQSWLWWDKGRPTCGQMDIVKQPDGLGEWRLERGRAVEVLTIPPSSLRSTPWPAKWFVVPTILLPLPVFPSSRDVPRLFTVSISYLGPPSTCHKQQTSKQSYRLSLHIKIHLQSTRGVYLGILMMLLLMLPSCCSWGLSEYEANWWPIFMPT